MKAEKKNYVVTILSDRAEIIYQITYTDRWKAERHFTRLLLEYTDLIKAGWKVSMKECYIK